MARCTLLLNCVISLVFFLVVFTTLCEGDCDCDDQNWTHSSHVEAGYTRRHGRYHVFQADRGVTWCQARWICEQHDYSLASIPDNEAQQEMKKILLASNVTGHTWLGGRRLTQGWTWIDDTLTQAESHTLGNCSSNDGVLWKAAEYIGAICNTIPGNRICKLKGYNTQVYNNTAGMTWYQAQTACQSDGGRLATLPEIQSSIINNLSDGEYYIGLYRNPWLWVTGDDTYRPVIYSNWNSQLTGERDCLVITINGQWLQKRCSAHYVRHVLCEGPPGIGELTTLPAVIDSQNEGIGELTTVPAVICSLDDSTLNWSNRLSIVAWSAAAVGNLVAVFLAVSWCRRKRRTRRLTTAVNVQTATGSAPVPNVVPVPAPTPVVNKLIPKDNTYHTIQEVYFCKTGDYLTPLSFPRDIEDSYLDTGLDPRLDQPTSAVYSNTDAACSGPELLPPTSR